MPGGKRGKKREVFGPSREFIALAKRPSTAAAARGFGITAELFFELGHAPFEVRLGLLSEHSLPVKPVQGCQVTLVSTFRSNCPFQNTLWKSCHLSALGSFARFSVLASISRQPVDPRVTLNLQPRPPCLPLVKTTPANAESKQYFAWCKTWCLKSDAFEARSKVRPSAASGQHQRRLPYWLRSAHTIPLLI